MAAAEQAHLSVVEPVAEPIVLVIEGQTVVTGPDDPAWPIAWYARERDQALQHAERDLRGKRALIEELRKTKKDEAEQARLDCPDREAILRIFDRWRTASGHARCKLTPERFDLAVARLAEEYDEATLTMAVVGVGSNPYVIDGERQDDYKTAMLSGERVERYANRCPAEARREIRATVSAAEGRLFDE